MDREIETDYWANLTATHTCGDYYPGGDYVDYPERAENVVLTVKGCFIRPIQWALQIRQLKMRHFFEI